MDNYGFSSVYSFLKNNKGIIKVCITVLSIIFFCISVFGIKNDESEMSVAVEKWYEQLPSEHWIKQDNDYTRELEYIFMNFYDEARISVYTVSRLSCEAVGQEGIGGTIVSEILKYNDTQNSDRYQVFDENGKRIKRVIVRQGDTAVVEFCFDDKPLLLDFSKEEYFDELEKSAKDCSIANSIVYSYSENPEVASIYNGLISGNSKGKTTVHFVCNGVNKKLIVSVK